MAGVVLQTAARRRVPEDQRHEVGVAGAGAAGAAIGGGQRGGGQGVFKVTGNVVQAAAVTRRVGVRLAAFDLECLKTIKIIC